MSFLESIVAGIFANKLTQVFDRAKFKKSEEKNHVQKINVVTCAKSTIFYPKRLFNKYKEKKIARDYKVLSDSTVFFADRFASAFPGCRGIQPFNDPNEAMHRLDVFFKNPIKAKFKNSTAKPLMWIRGGDTFNISSYKRFRNRFFKSNEFLLNGRYLFKLKKLVAFSHPSYFRSFIYIETQASGRSRLYEDNIAGQVKRNGYAREEYGVWGKLKERKISREEYDDASTIVNGKVKNLLGKTKLRIIYTTDFNFLIIPHFSPINNNQHDDRFEEILNSVLRKETCVDELARLAFKLPKNQTDY